MQTNERVSDLLAEDLLGLWRMLRDVARAERTEVTPEQFWLLRTLDQHGPSTIGDLAAALGILSSSVTVACKRLEQMGLVQRTRDRHDERVVHVSLTDTGREQIEAWRLRRRQILSGLLEPLSPDEQQQLRVLLGRVLDGAAAGAGRR